MFVMHSMGAAAIFWIAIAFIAVFGSFFGYRERASRHRMIETLAEKGQPIPPEYFDNGRYRYANRGVASGITLMCIGIALAIFFWAFTGGGDPFGGPEGRNWLPFIGIFPFMIGVGRVLGSMFDRPPSK